MEVLYVETSLLGWAFDWHCWGTAYDNLTISRQCFGDQTGTTCIISTSFHFILQRTWSIPSVLTNLSINIGSYPLFPFLFHSSLLTENYLFLTTFHISFHFYLLLLQIIAFIFEFQNSSLFSLFFILQLQIHSFCNRNQNLAKKRY